MVSVFGAWLKPYRETDNWFPVSKLRLAWIERVNQISGDNLLFSLYFCIVVMVAKLHRKRRFVKRKVCLHGVGGLTFRQKSSRNHDIKPLQRSSCSIQRKLEEIYLPTLLVSQSLLNFSFKESQPAWSRRQKTPVFKLISFIEKLRYFLIS